jgi:hypothetical protein
LQIALPCHTHPLRSYWAGKLNKWFKATVSEVVPHTELSSDRPNDQVVPGVYYCVLK